MKKSTALLWLTMLHAGTASALNHPNICTVYDIAEEGGKPFMVMELMEGESLRQRINGHAMQGVVKTG